MKSLSILILLGTITALVVGGIFAVSPVLASTPEVEVSAAQPLAPVTGAVEAEAELAQLPAPAAIAETAIDPGTVLANTFSVSIQKDTAGALAVQEAEAAVAAEAQVEAAAAAVADQAAAPVYASKESFISSVSNGNASQITGIYVEGALAYAVGNQPSGNGAYVTETPGEVTKFGLAAEYGTQAFLAHNYLAGSAFLTLSEGQIITLVYGDGSTADFVIQDVQRFQALSPDSTQSAFVNLADGKQLSASTLFHKMYNSDNSVVLQTCIANEGISTWGRLFIIAVPLS
jgi:hypothetical protein